MERTNYRRNICARQETRNVEYLLVVLLILILRHGGRVGHLLLLLSPTSTSIEWNRSIAIHRRHSLTYIIIRSLLLPSFLPALARTNQTKTKRDSDDKKERLLRLRHLSARTLTGAYSSVSWRVVSTFFRHSVLWQFRKRRMGSSHLRSSSLRQLDASVWNAARTPSPDYDAGSQRQQ